MRRAPLLLAAAALGCAAPAPRPPPQNVDAALDAWIAERQTEAPREVRSTRLAPAARLPPAANGATHIAAPPDDPPRPGRRGKVDVQFQRADLPNALQFLADAGRFNLVVDPGVTGQVSATLRGVDAYDALVALAQANGAEVRYERQIVLVRHR